MITVLSIPVREPFPWDAILRYLSHRSTPGIEQIAPGRYTRESASCRISVEYRAAAQALECSVEGADYPSVLPRIQRLFDPGHDPAPVERALCRSPILAPRIRALPGMRVPGCWDAFELCLRVILGQQVSVKAAHTLMGRLAARCPSLDPGGLAAADLAGLGLTGARLRTLQLFAAEVAGSVIRLDAPWEQIAAQMKELPGIGPWTLQYLSIRLGRDPDAFPESDLGLLRSVGVDTPRRLRDLAEQWRPYRAYAAMYLWNHNGE
jgi:DNA-3-methyladenine glycosylase II